VNEQTLEFGVSEFVDLLNQTLDFAYPSVVIHGELANLRVSKNRWVYFDLKDENSTVKFFATVYQLPGPLEDGMMLKVRGQPRLHKLYGFSVNVLSMQPTGAGSIKKAAELLKAKLVKEGLFDESRKRGLPYPPERIGLVASKQSAAYADFVKILNARWGGVEVEHIDVQVQGEVAPAQIVASIAQLNALSNPPEVIVIIRGGGSAEDLAVFSTEIVTRAVAASRVPTLVAIGHEVDLSLAELAADRRASTPSNAAEIVVPDKVQVLSQLQDVVAQLETDGLRRLRLAQIETSNYTKLLADLSRDIIAKTSVKVIGYRNLLKAFNPEAILRRGYAVVRDSQNKIVRKLASISADDIVNVQLADGKFNAQVAGKNRSNYAK
jgi:exodeoxyribonuclease VII large subunit